MASPTTVRVLHRSRSTVSHVSAGSSRRVFGGSTSVCPLLRPMNDAHWAAPCISGGRTRNRIGSANADAAAATSS